jgi:hypothetical protein
MMEEMIVLSLGLAFALLLLWLLRPRRQNGTGAAPTIDGALDIDFPKHFRYFPQIRQALSAGDDRYLREVAPPEVAHQVFRERRAVARNFLRGLHQDFSSLERLGRIVSSLSPVVSRKQESEQLLLGLQFRLLYGLVCLRLSTGRVPLGQIEHLTELIGRLALRMEQAMAHISALSAERLTREISA